MQRTQNQERAIQSVGGHLCVDAGAGSGKTTVLIDRILYLLENEHASVENIVAITFTEKAAAEMKARLRSECRRRAPKDDSTQMTFWRRLERRIDRARISTIHSFCMGILKEHALAMGLDPDFVPLTEAEDHLLISDVLQNTFHRLLDDGDEGALELAAEYGTSKTMKMVRELLKQRDRLEDIRQENALDDPRAVKRFLEGLVEAEQGPRLEEFKSGPELQAWRNELSSFDGLCADENDNREVLRVALLAALGGISEGHDIEAALRDIAALDAGGGSKKKWGDAGAFNRVKAIRDEIKEMAKELVLPEAEPYRDERAAEFLCRLIHVHDSVFEAYRLAKRQRTARSFDDLILDTVHMLRDRPDLRNRIARGIKFLLIDEFQDTNALQYELATALMNEVGGPQLTIVGDAKQSIYHFRGAEVSVFRTARSLLSTTVPLHTNFRTLPDALNFINDFFAASNTLGAVEVPYAPLEAHRNATDESHIEFLIPEEVDDTNTEAYRKLEADLIAFRIQELCAPGSGLMVYDKTTGEKRQAVYRDVAILFRSLSQVHLYERGLRLREIPFHVVAGRGFFERQEITDLRNLLTVVIDPWNEMALLAFLRSPLGGLSDEALLRIAMAGPLAKIFNEPQRPPMNKGEGLEECRALVHDLRSRRALPLVDFFHYLLERTHYEAMVLSQFLGVQKASNVRKLLGLAQGFSRTESPNLSAFVRYLDEVAQEGVREGESGVHTEATDAVTLMTIHKSKGLEFPIVFVADASRGYQYQENDVPLTIHRKAGASLKVVDPYGKLEATRAHAAITRRFKEEETEEYWRIFYVALTRARDHLVISGGPESRFKVTNWLRTLDECYSLFDQRDGGEIVGEGWRATVYRTCPSYKASRKKASELTEHGLETIDKQIGPITKYAVPKSFSVTRLIQIVFEEKEREDAPRHRSGDVDPLLRGTLVHRLFEDWDFSRGDLPDLDAFLAKQCPAIRERGLLRPQLEEIARRFHTSPVKERIAAHDRVLREVSFVLPLNGTLVSGAIDVLLPDGTIIDYKTGAYTPERHAKYEWQLRLYAAAIQQLLNLKPKTGLIYYVDLNEEKEVDLHAEQIRTTLEQARTAIQGAAPRE